MPKDLERDFFFELEIIDGGKNNMVGIGLHPPGTVAGMIGWGSGSYGYHADDGIIRNHDSNTKNQLTKWASND